MPPIEQLSVFQKIYDHYRALHADVKQFPKGDRHALGERALTTTLDMLEAVITAAHAKREWKIPGIEKALTKLEIQKILVRLSHETRILPESRYLHLSEQLQEIGRMLGGWRRSV